MRGVDRETLHWLSKTLDRVIDERDGLRTRLDRILDICEAELSGIPGRRGDGHILDRITDLAAKDQKK